MFADVIKYLEKIYSVANQFIMDPNSKFYWLYLVVYVLLSSLIIIRLKKINSISNFFNELFPRNLYFSRSSILDLKVLAINALILFPLIDFLFGLGNLEEGGLANYIGPLQKFVFSYLGLSFQLNGNATILGDILYTVGLFIVVDFAFFFGHTIHHKIPILWEIHKLHHSATVLTPFTFFRHHPLSSIIQKATIIFFVLVYIGSVKTFYPITFTPVKILGISFLMFAYNMLITFRHSHIWLDYGRLNYIFMSPAMHVVHHSYADKHIDKNMGMMLSIWDIIFKTVYITSKEEKLNFGLKKMNDEDDIKLQSLKISYLEPFRLILGILREMSFKKRAKYVPLFLIAILFSFGMIFGKILVNPFDNYSNSQITEQIKQEVGFKFTDVTNELGITHTNSMLIPHERRLRIAHWSSVYGGVSVGDVNRDGYPDLFFSRVNQNEDDILYINDKGKKFINLSEKWNLPKGSFSSTSAVFFDFDKDGYDDLYIARIGCHSLLKNNKGKNFIDVSEKYNINKICSWTTSVSVLDIDSDGYLDIYLGNYHDAPNITDAREYPHLSDRSRNNRKGGKNILLHNIKGNYFEDISNNSGADDSGYTFAIGISDFNLDRKPDIFVANDYGDSQLYINQGNFIFQNQTIQKVGKQKFKHSMSASVADVDNDGRTDIYLSNISDPGDYYGRNAMLLNKDDSMRQRSEFFKIDKCGFGWGTQFFDPDNDGRLDLIAVNGYWNDGPKDYWYNFLTIATLPPFIRKNPENYPSTYGTKFAGEQRPCLFYRNKSKFVDIAPFLGLEHIGQGRAVAIFDYNNDGRQDIILTYSDLKPVILKNQANQTDNKYNWIGLSLLGKKNPTDGTGAKVTVEIFNGKGRYIRENYAVQGYSSQNDKRLILGLNKAVSAKIKVEWPSGEIQHLDINEVNRYLKVEEPK